MSGGTTASSAIGAAGSAISGLAEIATAIAGQVAAGRAERLAHESRMAESSQAHQLLAQQSMARALSGGPIPWGTIALSSLAALALGIGASVIIRRRRSK